MRSRAPEACRAMLAAAAIGASIGGVSIGSAQEPVFFPTADGGRISADVYGSGTRAIVLAHGGRFDKGSWAAQARMLVEAGFRVLALDFRGYGDSTGPGESDPLAAPLHLDVRGAVEYLVSGGADSIAVVGASMGGSAAAEAAVASGAESITSLVLLASGAGEQPERIQVPTLFVIAQNDLEFDGTPRLVEIEKDYAKVPAPKDLVRVAGSAHAQYLFDTPQGAQVMQAILEFLSEH